MTSAAFYLIAAGFGYKIYAEAFSHSEPSVKKLGKIVGMVMIVTGLSGTVCSTFASIHEAKTGRGPMGNRPPAMMNFQQPGNFSPNMPMANPYSLGKNQNPNPFLEDFYRRRMARGQNRRTSPDGQSEMAPMPTQNQPGPGVLPAGTPVPSPVEETKK